MSDIKLTHYRRLAVVSSQFELHRTVVYAPESNH